MLRIFTATTAAALMCTASISFADYAYQGFEPAATPPAGAKPGECYVRVQTRASYRTETRQVVTKETSERIEIIPAEYRYETITVLAEDVVRNGTVVYKAGTPVSEIPELAGAGMGTGMGGGRLMTQRSVSVPATYGWEEERILVAPARTEWKKGHGPIERLDYATGEIVCLVETPPVYKTVRRQVVKTPATTRIVESPVSFKTIKIQRTVRPETERRVEIPAEYKTVTTRVLATPAESSWRTVLCETNTTPGVVSKIQRALDSAGFDPGEIDGVMGSQTMSAVRAYQQSKGLGTHGLTTETLQSLGISIGG